MRGASLTHSYSHAGTNPRARCLQQSLCFPWSPSAASTAAHGGRPTVKGGGKVGYVGGRIVNVCVVVATGVNADGQREILDLDVGASGFELVTSDAHQGLKNAIAVVFAGAS